MATLALITLGRSADMETYHPDEASGTKTDYVTSQADGKQHRVTIVNFGIEDAEPARKFGRHLARAGYSSRQAEAEIWRAAWERYPDDRFFARCFVEQADRAYTDAAR